MTDKKMQKLAAQYEDKFYVDFKNVVRDYVTRKVLPAGVIKSLYHVALLSKVECDATKAARTASK